MMIWRFDVSNKLLTLFAVGLMFVARPLTAQGNSDAEAAQRAAFEERQQARKVILSLTAKARDEKACKSSKCDTAWANLAALAHSFGAIGPKGAPHANEA